MTDELAKLAERIRGKDPEALARFIEAKRPQLLAFIERQLGTGLKKKVEADDVLQDMAAEAVRALPTNDLGERDPFSWLCHLAEQRIVDAHRHFFGAQKRDAGREIPLGTAGGGSDSPAIINMLVNSMTSPSMAYSRNAREARLQEALANLSEEQREAIRMRYVENLPSKEIATRLGKSDAAIRVLLTRTIKKLEEVLTKLE